MNESLSEFVERHRERLLTDMVDRAAATLVALAETRSPEALWPLATRVWDIVRARLRVPVEEEDVALNELARETFASGRAGDVICLLIGLRHSIAALIEEHPEGDATAWKEAVSQAIDQCLLDFDVKLIGQFEHLMTRAGEHLQSYMSQTTDLVLLFDLESGTILDANPVAERVLGYEKTELTRKTFLELVATPTRAAAEAALQELRATRFADLRDIALTAKDGRTIPVTFNPSLQMRGSVRLVLGILTERTRTKEELQQALQWYETIFEGSLQAIFISDAQGRFIAVNRAACELTGYSREELLSMCIPDLHDPEDLSAYRQFHQRIMAGEDIVSEARMRRKDGRKVDVQFHNRRIIIAGVPYMYTGARDITEVKEKMAEIHRQQGELTVRARILDAILNTWDLDERLQRILGEVMSFLNVEFGGIYLVRGQDVVLACWRGLSDNFLAAVRSFPIDALPEELLEPVVVHERLSEQGVTPEVVKREGIQAWACVPLHLPREEGGEAEWLGSLILGSRRYEALEEHRVAMLQHTRAQLALAIDHARSHRRARERLVRLQTLREIDRAIIQHLDLEHILRITLERVPRELGAEAVAISLLDEESMRPSVFIMRLPNGTLIEEEAFTLAESLLHWFVDRREPVIIYDVSQDPRVQTHYRLIRRHRLASYLGVPLVVHDETIGLLHILTTEPRVFADEDIEFFRTLAGQAAIAIANARAFAEAIERAEAVETVLEAQPEIALRPPEHAGALLLETLERCTGVTSLLYFHHDEKTRTLTLAEARGISPELLAEMRSQWRFALGERRGLIGWVAEQRQPFYVPETHNQPDWVTIIPHVRSAYLLPLKFGARVFGVVALLTEEVQGFPKARRALADVFADYVGATLESARLLHALQTRATQLETLNAIIATAAGATDLQQLLETSLDRMLQVLEVDQGAIWVTGHRVMRGLPAEVGGACVNAAVEAGVEIPECIAIEDWQAERVPPPYLQLAPLMKRFGIRASLTVPIQAEGHRIGGLSVASPHPRAWTTEEIALIDSIGQQLGEAAERLRLLTRTRRQAEQMQQVLNTVPAGMVLLDDERRILQANPAAEEFLDVLAGARVGMVLSHLVGRPIEEFLEPPEGRFYHEISVQKPQPRVFELEARPMTAGARLAGWVLFIREVTAEREVQKRVETQERLAAIGQLAAGIAHDFNNLLTGIIGFAELIQMRDDVPDVVRGHLIRITKQGQRASQLIRQILDFSRQSVSQPRPLDLVPFLKETTKFLERTIPEHVRLTLEIGAGEHVVNADPTQMQQVITNLAVNARDAMPEGGELTVRLTTLAVEPDQPPPCAGMHPGRWVALSVSDTGMGIPHHVRERIFEPFFTTKKPGQGTGLGLAQVYGIVAQHGGFIDVSSQVGRGTTFTIYLPALLAEAEVDEESRVEGVPHGRGETILLVEDEPEVREAIQAILTHLGYRVLPAVNGREALNVYERRHADIDLVITDLVMPEMDGVALIKALRARDPRVKIIVMSGYPLKAERERGTLEGIVEWIQKPVALPQLAAVMRRLIGPE